MNNLAHQSVLLTGGTGFIGRRMVRQLIERRCRVWCLVRANANVDELRSSGAELVVGDVADQQSVKRALVESSARVVFHLAGLVRAWHRGDFARVNRGGVHKMAAECAERADPPTLVVVSSLSAAGPTAGAQPRLEDEIPAPVSEYGRSKLAGEFAAGRFAGAMPISIVRPPIVFGPGDQGVLQMFRPIARWGLHAVPGQGDSFVSLLHVDDLINGLCLVAEKGERLPARAAPGRGVYYLATHDPLTYTQLGCAIATALGRRPPQILHVPASAARVLGRCGDMVAILRKRAGWISSDKITEALAGSWTCSADKAREQLNWSPAESLTDRLHSTVQWYREVGWL